MGNKLSLKASKKVKNVTFINSLSGYDVEIQETGVLSASLKIWTRITTKYPKKLSECISQCISDCVETETETETNNQSEEKKEMPYLNLFNQIGYILKLLCDGNTNAVNEMESICKYMRGLCHTLHISYDCLTNIWHSFDSTFDKTIGFQLNLGQRYCLHVAFVYITSLIFTVEEWASSSSFEDVDSEDGNNSNPHLKLELSPDTTVYAPWNEDLDALLALSHPKQCCKLVLNPFGMKYLGGFMGSEGDNGVLSFIRDYNTYIRYSRDVGDDKIEACVTLGNLFVNHYLDILEDKSIISSLQKYQIETEWLNNSDDSITRNMIFYTLYSDVCQWLDENWLPTFFQNMNEYLQPKECRKIPNFASFSSDSTIDGREDSIQLF